MSTNNMKSLQVEMLDVKDDLHTFTKKRRLDKVRIKSLQLKLAHTKPFNLRNEMNLDTSLPIESRNVPKLQSLYQLTYRQRQKERCAGSVVDSLLEMQNSTNFGSSIRDIGASPFHVMYWTEKQKVF